MAAPQRCRLEAYGPALGALLKGGNVGRRDGEAHALTQNGGGLIGGEAQVGGAGRVGLERGEQVDKKAGRAAAAIAGLSKRLKKGE